MSNGGAEFGLEHGDVVVVLVDVEDVVAKVGEGQRGLGLQFQKCGVDDFGDGGDARTAQRDDTGGEQHRNRRLRVPDNHASFDERQLQQVDVALQQRQGGLLDSVGVDVEPVRFLRSMRGERGYEKELLPIRYVADETIRDTFVFGL